MASSQTVIKFISHNHTLASEISALAQSDSAVRALASDGQLDYSDRIVFLDAQYLAERPFSEWQQQAPDAIFICEVDDAASKQFSFNSDCFLVEKNSPPIFLQNALKQAVQLFQQKQQNRKLSGKIEIGQQKLTELSRIGASLASQRDHQKLIEDILSVARRMAKCDAASLFLMAQDDQELIFKHSQNDSIAVNFVEKRFPLSRESVAGFTALTQELVNIDDVYQMPSDAPFRFNSSFDKKIGYRTCSMLVLPMVGYNDHVIGVIQFINRKKDMRCKLTNEQITLEQTQPFSHEDVVLLSALAGLAAVAIENNTFIKQLDHLFEGFVNASVRAIEHRDPSTSGHSFRVADLTCALARAAMDCRQPIFRDFNINKQELRELRYAALLHDFGKVSVSEHVLVKANKLSEESYSEFVYRMALEKARIANFYLTKRLKAMQQGQLNEVYDQQLQVEMAEKTERLDAFLSLVTDSNKPSLLPEQASEYLQQVRDYKIEDVRYGERGLISQHEYQALCIKRGSLTEVERSEIEGHVRHTIDFLSRIPWPKELCQVAHIAGAHHEKLNGSGYPKGLTADEIPIGAKMMAVCDIFDALTAADRPYKSAVPLDRAMSILQSEVQSQHIDADLLQLFKQQKIYQIVGI